MSSTDLTFQVLGHVGARREGLPLSLGGSQQRRLLAALLTQPDTDVPIDRLIEVLWDDPPSEARRTLMSYVSRLRSVLGRDVIGQRAGGYRLITAGAEIDARRLDSLVSRAQASPPTEAIALLDEAVALVHGPAFGEFAHEWWALQEASRLAELVVAAKEHRAEALVKVGRSEHAVSDLAEIIVAHPHRATAVAVQARALVGLGRDAEALREIGDLRRRLAEDTGLELPSAIADYENDILLGRGAVPPSAGGYRLGERIGQGAHGSVYKSVQPTLGREVAIKVVREEFADDPAFVTRFEVEAQLVSRLEHPHIVPLYDFWREPGGAFLVFRLIDGGTIADDLRAGGPWDLPRVDRLVEEIGGALSLAHASSVVHGDIKPSNVLLDRTGRSYLGDFGLATTSMSHLTNPAWSDPSPYRPPEAAHGRRPTVSGDVFGFGAMLHELLAGHPPSITADLAVGVEPLDHRVDAIVRRALDPDPLRRFASIDEMITEWRSSVSGSASPATVRAPKRNPYVGMRAFEEADAQWFRSRTEVVGALVDRLTDERFLVVVGPSGSGKSSLLHAGLAPRLRAGGGAVASMVPGDAPLDRLRAALASIATRDVGASLQDLAASISTDRGQLVILLDQLEEIWTTDETQAADGFLETVMDLLDHGDPSITVIGAMRADFYDRALQSPLLGPRLAMATVPLPPMSTAELAAVIREPAASVGVQFEPGLEARMLADVVGRPGGLPMLQFTLHELFLNCSGTLIAAEAYDALGGVAGSLATQAEAVLVALDSDQQEIARSLFHSVVHTGSDAVPVGRRRRRRDLPADASNVIDQFVGLRLLATDVEPSTREPTIELAHEALISSWPRLGRWLADDGERHAVAERLEAAAHEWDAAGRPEADLYRGARLESAQALVAAGWPTLTTHDREFVAAATRASERERATELRSKRRTRQLLTAVSLALVLAIAGGLIAFTQRRDAQAQAKAADVTSLVNLSHSLVTTKRDLSVLLALRASLASPGAATDGALMTAIYTEPSYLGELSPSRPLRSIASTANGQVVWGLPMDGTDGLLRLDVGARTEHVVQLNGQASRRIASVTLVDDSKAIVASEPDDSGTTDLALVDLEHGQTLKITTLAMLVSDVAVAPGRGRVAVTAATIDAKPASVVVMSLPTLEVVSAAVQPGPVDLPPGAAWFSSSAWVDDQTLAIGSTSGRIALWRPDEGQVVLRINDPPDPRSPQVASVLAVTDDGATLVAADLLADGSHGSGMMAFDLDDGSAAWPRAVRANPSFVIDEHNSRVIAQEAGPGSSRAFSYDLATGERLDGSYDTQHGSLCHLAVTPDASRLLMSSCNDASVGQWALDGSTPAGAAVGDPGWTTGWNLWAAGDRVGMYDLDGRLTIRDMATRELTAAPDGLDLGAWSWFLTDGRLMNVFPIEDQVVVYDRQLSQPIRFTADIPDQPNAMAWSRDGSVLVVGAGDSDDIAVIDVNMQRERLRLHTGDGRSLGLDVLPDGSRLFAGSQGEVAAVFDLATGDRIGELPTTANVTVSPDGTLVAGSSFDGTITLWNSTTLQPSGDRLSGSTSFSNSMQFTFDGRLLITSGLDNTQRIWDLATRRQIGPELPVTAWTVAIAPDSSRIAINQAEGVRLMDLDRALLRAEACRIAGRDLTEDEWHRYLKGRQEPLCPSFDRSADAFTPTPDRSLGA